MKKYHACTLSSYCDASYQKNHRNEHRAECNRRVKEIKAAMNIGNEYDQLLDEVDIDIKTFVVPGRQECPICCIPFPFSAKK